MKSPISIPGIVLESSRRLPGLEILQCYYKFTAQATAETVEALIGTMTERRNLTFFDSLHPQMSDPGAYITIAKQGSDLLAMRGNHGWSSAWIPVSKQEIIRYLASCIPYNGPVLPETLCTFEPDDSLSRGKIDQSPNSEFRKYLNARNRD